MQFPISFLFTNSLKYYIYYILSGLFGYIIRDKYKEEMNTIFNLLLMYIGESFALFFYLYELYQFKTKIKNYQVEENLIPESMNKKKLFFLLFWCSILDLIGTVDYKQFIYTYDMKKIDKDYFERAFICLFIFMNEYYYLKIQNYIHQKLGIGINLSCLFLTSFIKLINNGCKLSSFFYSIVIIMQCTYIQSFLFILEKKLNYEYYINIYFICFIEGIFGTIILLFIIFFLKFYNPFDYNTILINEKLISEFGLNKLIFWFFIIPLYAFSLTIVNISRLKIIEKNRPSFIIIGKAFRNLLFAIVDTLKNNYINKDVYAIINMFVSLLGSLILGEMIILNFFDLNKYTSILTAKRGELEMKYINNIRIKN